MGGRASVKKKGVKRWDGKQVSDFPALSNRQLYIWDFKDGCKQRDYTIPQAL
jgi:hypothetical protein